MRRRRRWRRRRRRRRRGRARRWRRRRRRGRRRPILAAVAAIDRRDAEGRCVRPLVTRKDDAASTVSLCHVLGARPAKLIHPARCVLTRSLRSGDSLRSSYSRASRLRRGHCRFSFHGGGSGKSAVATTRRLATGTAVQTCRPVHGSGSPFMTFGESCTCADAIARTRTCAMAVLRKVCTRSTVRILPIGRIGAVLQTHRQRHDLAYQNAAHGRERSPPTTRLFRVPNFFITTAMRRLCA